MAVSIEKIKGTNRQAGKKWGDTAGIFLFLFLLGIFMALPIYLALLMSVKPVHELFIFPPKFYVIDPTLDNFRDMFQNLSNLYVPFSRYVFNSVLVTVCVTAVQCIFSSMAAFVLAKCEFPASEFLNKLIVISLLYQSNVIYIMQYIVISKLHMLDTYWALILPAAASPMCVFLMRQSITAVPDSIIEAAKVDGANLFTICWKIVMPNQKPALMTMLIFSFQSAWNIQGGTFIYHESLKTLPTVVKQAADAGLARAGTAMASAVLMLIPPVLLFMAVQKHVIETMAYSGIKE